MAKRLRLVAPLGQFGLGPIPSCKTKMEKLKKTTPQGRTIYIPDDLYRQLKAQLTLEGTNVSAWVRDTAQDKLDGLLSLGENGGIRE